MKPNIFKALFSLIGGISFAAALVILPGWQKFGFAMPAGRQAAALVVVPLLLESFGAIGLAGDWFLTHKIRPGKVVNLLQWIAGIFGIAGIFDLTMRLTRKSDWMVSGIEVFVIDAILVVLFMLWLVVSHYINKSMKEGKACQFCP